MNTQEYALLMDAYFTVNGVSNDMQYGGGGDAVEREHRKLAIRALIRVGDGCGARTIKWTFKDSFDGPIGNDGADDWRFGTRYPDDDAIQWLAQDYYERAEKATAEMLAAQVT